MNLVVIVCVGKGRVASDLEVGEGDVCGAGAQVENCLDGPVEAGVADVCWWPFSARWLG